MSNKDVTIRGRTGKKLCEISAPQGWRNWIGIPLFPLPLIVYEKKEWNNPDAVVWWAWLQALSIIQMRQKLSAQFTRQSRFYCIACGQISVAPRFNWIWKNRIAGFECLNKKCSMKKVFLPAIMLVHIDQIPTDFGLDITIRK